MNYNKQIDRIVEYFHRQEKTHDNLKIGGEFEHFVVRENDLSAVRYDENNRDGIRDLLNYLLQRGWRGNFESDNLIGLEKEGSTVTLEPGAQIELSTQHTSNLSEIERIYRNFVFDLMPWLEDNQQLLIALGYQPHSKIEDIPFIPKQRYVFMSDYLSQKGKYALNMMKGTASTQLALDYLNEEDYAKKFQVACYLSPLLAILTDNSPIFEGERYKKYALRTNIWLHCDDDRCGIIPHAFDDDFCYATYARYILDRPPIIITREGQLCSTEDQPFKAIFDPEECTDKELEQVLTMFFPDVRTKQFIEIRTADSIPYPLNFAYLALLKGLLYDCKNIKTIHETVTGCFEFKKILALQQDIIKKGLKAKACDKHIMQVILKFVNLAKEGLVKEEQKYLEPLYKLVEIRKNPVTLIDEKLKDDMPLKEALRDCIINNQFL
ncbi:MAG: glutamate-cysteine ligase family protein [Candidatus Celaenobacter polaris]|nr:glutamate-cysteine ligase family protein [Candidatus Celaenobacter polaris]